MKTAVCFLTILGLAFGLPASIPEYTFANLTANNVYVEPIEGAPVYETGRIIGGTEATRNSLPYQVAVIINGGSFCGGSLISRAAVLTAAHCTISASVVQALLAAHNVQQSTETGRVTVTSTSVRNHPNYNTNNFNNDIAIVLLPSQVTLTSSIQLISLAPASAGTYAGSTAVLSGWGRTSDASNAISPVLRRVNLSVITNAVCQASYGTSSVVATTICTSGAGNIGACNGDSGGPLVVSGVQVGVVSFGSSRCQAGSPTAYARVSSFRTWIASIAGV